VAELLRAAVEEVFVVKPVEKATASEPAVRRIASSA